MPSGQHGLPLPTQGRHQVGDLVWDVPGFGNSFGTVTCQRGFDLSGFTYQVALLVCMEGMFVACKTQHSSQQSQVGCQQLSEINFQTGTLSLHSCQSRTSFVSHVFGGDQWTSIKKHQETSRNALTTGIVRLSAVQMCAGVHYSSHTLRYWHCCKA